MSISARNGARGSKDWPWKYYNVQKGEGRFTLELGAGKNKYYIKNTSTKSC